MPILNTGIATGFDILKIQTDLPIVRPGGRLSLSSANPVANGSDATGFYYLPYDHALLPVYVDLHERWEYRRIPDAGISYSLTGLNPGPFDIYAQSANNSNGFAIALQGWSNDISRFRSLTRKDGILCLDYTGTSASRRTYLGTIRLTGSAGSAKAQDSDTQRLVFNAYNRVLKRMQRRETASSWTYNSSTWRPFNNSTANRLEIVDGIGQGVLNLTLTGRASIPSGGYAFMSCMANATNGGTTPIGTISGIGSTSDETLCLNYDFNTSLGYSYFQATEAALGGTATFYGQGYSELRASWLA